MRYEYHRTYRRVSLDKNRIKFDKGLSLNVSGGYWLAQPFGCPGQPDVRLTDRVHSTGHVRPTDRKDSQPWQLLPTEQTPGMGRHCPAWSK